MSFKGRSLAAICKMIDKLAQRNFEYGNSLAAIASKLGPAVDNVLMRNAKIDVLWETTSPTTFSMGTIPIPTGFDILILDTNDTDVILNYTRGLELTTFNASGKGISHMHRAIRIKTSGNYISEIEIEECSNFNTIINSDGTVSTSNQTLNSRLVPIRIIGIKLL